MFLPIMFAGALALPADLPVRTMRDGCLVSEGRPKASICVEGLKPLPPLAFPLMDVSWVERRMFVDANPGQRIRRMVVVQFEEALPDSGIRYRFGSPNPVRFGAQDYVFNTFAYDEEADAARNPGHEPDEMRKALREQGFVLPRTWRVARLARIADEQNRSEVIFFYFEDADADPTPTDADGRALTAEETNQMLETMRRLVTVR